MLNEFLQQLDGPYDNAEILTIMTTNMDIKKEIDEAILRPGRVDYFIKFDKPDLDSSIKFYKTILSEFPQISDDAILKGSSQQLSYAQMGEVVNVAKQIAIDHDDIDKFAEKLELNDSHILEAISLVVKVGDKDTEKLGFIKTRNNECPSAVGENLQPGVYA
jgi:ATP-dependent 26S proteasome regulatory subunit